jgi:hypothetical protein
MHSQRITLAAVSLALVASGLLTACAGGEAGTAPPAPATSAAATTSAAAAAPSTTRSAATRATAAPSEGATPAVEPVDCGEVGPEGGDQVDLIADSTPAGRVGCTEAINVISAYYHDAPTKAEGTAHHLVVDGWDCAADTGAYGSGSIGCAKDGLAFHTEP